MSRRRSLLAPWHPTPKSRHLAPDNTLTYVIGMVDRDYELREVLDTYRRDGSMIQGKSRVLLEELLEKLYPHMCNPEASAGTILDIGKFLMELGDMKPKAAAQQQSGPGFSITISIPQADGKPPITIEGVASPSSSSEFDELEGSPPRTALTIPLADLNRDLTEGL